MTPEGKFKKKLVEKLETIFPEAIVFRPDPNEHQGIPDLLILHENKWASLECKKSAGAKHQPNQDYYVSKMNDMSFSAFIFPENEEEVLNALQQSFRSRR